ncbi:hypothetical protein HK405_004042 [Cladochytrium tenue]|nr:hypothetical protein HK405_004042 [Cladochytrium tenue]
MLRRPTRLVATALWCPSCHITPPRCILPSPQPTATAAAITAVAAAARRNASSLIRSPAAATVSNDGAKADGAPSQPAKPSWHAGRRRRHGGENGDAASSDRPQNFKRTYLSRKLRALAEGGGGDGGRFVDLMVLRLTAGSGGRGGIHFARSLTQPLGPSAGGNGGRGGDVYVVGTRELTSLNSVLQRYRAEDGGRGGPNHQHGANGSDVVIQLPIGTVVRQVDSQEELARLKRFERGEVDEEDEQQREARLARSAAEALPGETDEERRERVAAERDRARLELVSRHFYFPDSYTPRPDRIKYLLERIPPRTPQPSDQAPLQIELLREGERHLVARGGRGGLGNPHFSPAGNVQLRGFAVAGLGEPGAAVWLEAELRTLADVGLVGLPNAGKSTLLAALTAARPRVAAHPFTTLRPHVGTLGGADGAADVRVADVPGLVAGAHLGVGLGHAFLRHIERCRAFLFVVDLSAPDPAGDLRLLRAELDAHSPGLASRPAIVVANKADLLARAGDNGRRPAAMDALVHAAGPGVPVVPVSARDRKNVAVLVDQLQALTDRLGSEEAT